jgi:hypothetical protein
MEEQNTNDAAATYANKSQGLAELTKALINVQRNVNGAKTNKVNPHLNNKYADLASVWDTCRELLADNGLAVTHTFEDSAADTVKCMATLLHVSGQSITSSLTMKLAKSTPQEVGSAATYARRYTLAALVGIVIDDDDDGNKASKPAKPANELEETKAEIRAALKVYKGADKEDIIGECQIAQETGNFDMKFARDIMAKILIKK